MSNAQILDQDSLDTLFIKARTHGVWRDQDVPEDLLRRLYDIMKFGPTEANTCPMRIVFIRSPEAKNRLEPLMDEGNKKKTMLAPVNAILAYDLKFYEHMDKLFPHAPGARGWYEGNAAKIQTAALRNGSLQAAYFMLAARSLGLDCGPMAGFSVEGVKAEFFKDDDFVPNIICNVGYGDPAALHPRSPRFTFEEVCSIL